MRLLIIGHLNGHAITAGKIAVGRGAKVTQADDIEQGLSALRNGNGTDLVMVDAKLDVAVLVDSLKAERFTLPVVACGIGNDTAEAVRAIKAGAKEYVPLPPDPELIAAIFEAVTEEDDEVIYADPSMKKVFDLADQVAPSEASIMITGESGTGKEVMARYIHQKSRRSRAAFISVNCAAIPENLLESELFGHEKGAFTGAVARRVGKFEEAEGGTLLLDEISEMDPRLQAKLLRAIQEREIDRVGGTKPVKVNIRVIATTNRDLNAEVRKGTFREDLMFRLNVVTLDLPPLRDRKSDIPLLARHFALKYAELNHMPKRPLNDDALTLLSAHPWRGNVRELENTMHRAVLLAVEDEITPAAIRLSDGSALETGIPAPEGTIATDGASDAAAGPAVEAAGAALVGRTVADVERVLIIETLEHCLGNRTHAANILGISIRTLRNKLKQYSDDGVAVPASGQADSARATAGA